MEKERKKKQKAKIALEHVDVIGDAFWEARPYILAPKKGDGGGE
jgi:tRNA(His) guanylyltransferase